MPDPTEEYGALRTRLDAFTREAERLYAGDIEALHGARVASRRLRELLPLLQLSDDTARNLSRRLRKVTRRLGVVRELDVLMLVIEELGGDARYPPTALTQVGTALESVRTAARSRLVEKLPLEKMNRLTQRLERAARRLDPGNPRNHRGAKRKVGKTWESALEASAARRAAGVRSAIETAGVVYVAQRLHDVRIALKKLRYVAEVKAEARDPRLAPDITVLKTAQDLLGRMHDLEVLIDRVRGVQASMDPPELGAYPDLSTLVHALEADCRTLHARYLQQREKLVALADRLGSANPLAA